jgi:hypothetical protein
MDFGARMVFRHNTVTCEYIQSHSVRNSSRGGNAKLEIYNNTFIGNGFYRPALIRGGPAIVFNNTFSGYSSNNIYIDDQRSTGDVNSQVWVLFTGNAGGLPIHLAPHLIRTRGMET